MDLVKAILDLFGSGEEAKPGTGGVSSGAGKPAGAAKPVDSGKPVPEDGVNVFVDSDSLLNGTSEETQAETWEDDPFEIVDPWAGEAEADPETEDEGIFLGEQESAGVSTGRAIRVTSVTETLETQLKKDFIARLVEIGQAYRQEVSDGLKTIFGERMTPEILDDILGQSDAESSTLLPDKVYVADGFYLRGANGCYIRDKRWVFLRSDLAKEVFAERGLTYARAEIRNIEFDAPEAFEPHSEGSGSQAGGSGQGAADDGRGFRRSPELYDPGEDDAYKSLFATFCEEVGHHLDEYVGMKLEPGYRDGPGDEGELFAILMLEGHGRLARGESLFTAEELAHAWRDNDAGIATVRTEAGEEKDLVVEFQSVGAKKKEETAVAYMVMYLQGDKRVDFHTNRGRYRYTLTEIDGIPEGEYEVEVRNLGRDAKGANLIFDFEIPGAAMQANIPVAFTYRVAADQPNPETFFAPQDHVHVTVVNGEAPPNVKQKSSPGDEGTADAMDVCRSGQAAGIKVFPYRGTRLGGAPLISYQDQENGDVIVKYPLYVKWNENFKKQTDTFKSPEDPQGYLPFLGGIRLRYNEVVRVHTYEPKWWDLNLVGDTHSAIVDDVEEEYCATAEDMLELGEKSKRDTFVNIAMTGVDAVTLIVPVGKLLAPLTKPLAAAGTRAARALAVGVMLGLREVEAFSAIATRASVVMVEHQMVGQAANRAVSRTVSHAVIEFSESATVHAGSAVVDKAATGAVVNGIGKSATAVTGRTATVTFVDSAGRKLVEKLVTPTGDAAADAMINRAFDAAKTQAAKSGATGAAEQGVVKTAPELVGGLTQKNVEVFRTLLARPLNSPGIQVLDGIWTQAARSTDRGILSLANSRHLFNLQRKRFWTAVAKDPAAKKIFTDAGCTFGKAGTAPVFKFNGKAIRLTLDHIVERQSAPGLSLTGSNLRLSLTKENTVVLRLINQMDVFQHGAEIEKMTWDAINATTKAGP